VVIYPEGTRATPARRVKALARLEASDRPRDLERAKALKHLLPPRPAGVLELLEQSPDAQVCFLGHVGMERFTKVTDMIGGRLFGQRIQVRRWVLPRHEVPSGKEERIEWLWQAWERMDQWIETEGQAEEAGSGAEAD